MTANDLKPIETVYNGYRFRSRLEARWAVFFDFLGIKYEYEKEGYDLGEAGWYLPDFWLPAQQCWIEIKPDTVPDERALGLAEALCGAGGYPVVILRAPVSNHSQNCYAVDIGDSSGGRSFWNVLWYICATCGHPGFSWGDQDHMIVGPDWAPLDRKCCRPPRLAHEFNHPSLNVAFDAARQARFEHGERGSRTTD